MTEQTIKKSVPPKQGYCYRNVAQSVERPFVFQAVYSCKSYKVLDKTLQAQ